MHTHIFHLVAAVVWIVVIDDVVHVAFHVVDIVVLGIVVGCLQEYFEEKCTTNLENIFSAKVFEIKIFTSI